MNVQVSHFDSAMKNSSSALQKDLDHMYAMFSKNLKHMESRNDVKFAAIDISLKHVETSLKNLKKMVMELNEQRDNPNT